MISISELYTSYGKWSLHYYFLAAAMANRSYLWYIPTHNYMLTVTCLGTRGTYPPTKGLNITHLLTYDIYDNYHIAMNPK
jgi:hypothetical protein